MTDVGIDEIDPAVLHNPAELRRRLDLAGREGAEQLMASGGIVDLQDVAAVLVAGGRLCRDVGGEIGADDEDVAAMFGHLCWSLAEQLMLSAVLANTTATDGAKTN